MKKPDPGIEKVRSARRRISRDAGNDPEKLIKHYIEYQKQFGDRLREGPEAEEDKPETAAAEQRSAPDRP